MNWADLQTGIVAALQVALADPEADVSWDYTRAFRKDVNATLTLVSFKPVGKPETRVADNGESTRVYHNSVLLIDAQFQAQRGTLANSAIASASRAYLGMWTSLALEELPEGVALTSVQGPIPVKDFESNGRKVSGAILSLQFNAAAAIDGSPIFPIEEAFIDGTVDEA